MMMMMTTTLFWRSFVQVNLGHQEPGLAWSDVALIDSLQHCPTSDHANPGSWLTHSVRGTSLLWRSTVTFTYLKVKSAKCLCLLPVVLDLVLVLRICSCLHHRWAAAWRQRGQLCWWWHNKTYNGLRVSGIDCSLVRITLPQL